MKYVYVAGPYSVGETVQNVREAVLVGNELTTFGFAVYIPHLNLFWHYLRPAADDFWYEHDLAWLLKCDILVRLPGESPGADNEVEVANANGILVAHWPQDMQLLRTLALWTPIEDDFSHAPDD